jgi:maltooligosyltrehalose trehalohydrolase
MGEEYGETAPFPYFVSHSDPGLIEAIRRSRREEFAYYQWPDEPPDPQEESTGQSARLDHTLRHQGKHHILYAWYRELIRLRNETRVGLGLSKDRLEVVCLEKEKTLVVRRWGREEQVAAIFHFGDTAVSVDVPLPDGRWLKRLASGEERWNGPGGDLPAVLPSDGKVSVTLTKQAFLLVSRRQED